MNNIYGYHRTSTKEQHLDRGIKAINDFCNEKGYELTELFTDQQTGKNFDRPDYKVLKRMAKRGDTIIIKELDRLGRDKASTMKEIRYFKDNGIRLMVLELPTTLTDLSSMDNKMAEMMMETINNMLIEMYVSFAHAEMEKRATRQKEGIEQAKIQGKHLGRVGKMDYNTFKIEYYKSIEEGLNPFEIIKKLEIPKATYYYYKKKLDDANK